MKQWVLILFYRPTIFCSIGVVNCSLWQIILILGGGKCVLYAIELFLKLLEMKWVLIDFVGFSLKWSGFVLFNGITCFIWYWCFSYQRCESVCFNCFWLGVFLIRFVQHRCVFPSYQDGGKKNDIQYDRTLFSPGIDCLSSNYRRQASFCRLYSLVARSVDLSILRYAEGLNNLSICNLFYQNIKVGSKYFTYSYWSYCLVYYIKTLFAWIQHCSTNWFLPLIYYSPKMILFWVAKFRSQMPY